MNPLFLLINSTKGKKVILCINLLAFFIGCLFSEKVFHFSDTNNYIKNGYFLPYL